jgi:hypothetical protein
MNAPFPVSLFPSLALLLALLAPGVRAQNVIYGMGPIPPKTRAPVTIVEQPSMALRTDGSTQPTRIYSIRVCDPPPPVVIQQKQTTSVTTVKTRPKKKVETVSVKKETHTTKPRHASHPRKKTPVLTRTSRPKKHVVVENRKVTRHPAPTVVTHEKTVTVFRPTLPASEPTWVNSGTMDALVLPPNGAVPQWDTSRVMTISAQIPQPAYRIERETTEVRSEPEPANELSADTRRESVIDAGLFPARSEMNDSVSAPASAVPVAAPSGKPGFVKSPFPPHDDLDARGLAHGTLARDPVSGRQFRIP